MRILISTRSFAFCLACTFATPALSQEAKTAADGSQKIGEDIIVTAQKRESRLQETPLAISAISGDALLREKISTIQDLAASLPSLDFAKSPNSTLLAVRGVGSINVNVGTESRVAIHTDGVYISRPEQALNQLFDIERIEYVRGPQGTLYGRNATAGAINIITRDPTSRFGGYIEGTFGNYSTANVEGAVSLPINSKLSTRIAFDYTSHDGFGKDITSGRGINDLNAGAIRAKIKYDTNPFTLVLSATYGKRDDHSGAFTYVGPGSPGVTPIGIALGGRVANFTDIATDPFGFPSTKNQYYSLTANGVIHIGEYDVVTILGYGHYDQHIVTDTDMTSAPLTRLEVSSISHQASAEVRVHRGSDKFDAIAGAYAFHEKLDGIIDIPINLALVGVPSPAPFVQGIVTGGDERTTAYAAFTQLRYNFTPALYLEAGLRFSHERKGAVDGTEVNTATIYNLGDPLPTGLSTPPPEARRSWSSLDPRLTLGYKPSRHFLAYATFSRGFKSGGFNLGSSGQSFAPERITAYEVGVKATVPRVHLTTNLSAFYYNYANMQVLRVNGVMTELVNAAASTIKGLEVELNWSPLPGFNIGASTDLLDGKYKNFATANPAQLGLGVLQLAGNRLPQAPKYRTRLDAKYRWALGNGDMTLRAETVFTGKEYFTPFNTIAESTGASTEFNAYLTYDKGKNTFQVFGRNLSNERKLVFAQTSSGLLSGFAVQGTPNDPRTYGVSFTRRW